MPCNSLSAGTAPQHYTRPRLHTNTTHCPSVFTRLAGMPHSLLTQSDKTPTDHEEQPVPQQFLQRHTIQQSTRAALIEPETGWLATGNPHRQPPATYGAHQSRNSSTPPSKRTKRHDHNQPHQLGPHIHKRWTNSPPLAVVEAPVRAATIAPPTPAPVGPLGFLGQLDGVSLKIENVSHGFHLLPWFSVFGLGSSPTVPRC